MALGQKTGGRQRGTPNRATAARAAAIAASGLTPLDYLLDVMRDTGNELDKRLDAAKAAAPYVHPKLASVELTGDEGKPIQTITRFERVIVTPEGKRHGYGRENTENDREGGAHE
jgi:hypothetical protein